MQAGLRISRKDYRRLQAEEGGAGQPPPAQLARLDLNQFLNGKKRLAFAKTKQATLPPEAQNL